VVSGTAPSLSTPGRVFLIRLHYSVIALCTYITSCYINGSDSDHGQVQGRGPDPDPSPVSDPGAGAFFATAQPLVVSPVFFCDRSWIVTVATHRQWEVM